MSGNIFQTQPQAQPQLQQMQQMKQILGTLDPNQSPQQMLQALAAQNPQFGNILNLLNNNNGDIRSLVTNLAQMKGVDLNALYQQFKALN